MEASFLLSLPKTILELAVALFKIKKDDRTKQRLADLLAQVADCVDEIANGISGGTHPTARCSELIMYIHNIERLAEEHTDKPTAQRLTLWLSHVADVPGIAKLDLEAELASATRPKWSQAKRSQQADSVREAAGTIRALGNLLRV